MTATAAEWSASLLALLTASGETVTIDNGTATTSALGRLTKPKSDEVTDSVDQQEWSCVLLADLDYPPERGFTAAAGGVTYAIVAVYPRKVGSTVIAFDLTLVGA